MSEKEHVKVLGMDFYIVWYSSANFQGDSYCWVKYVLSLTLLPFSFFGLMDSSPLQGALEWTWGRFFFSELKGWRGTSNHWGHYNQSKGPDESLLFWEWGIRGSLVAVLIFLKHLWILGKGKAMLRREGLLLRYCRSRTLVVIGDFLV